MVVYVGCDGDDFDGVCGVGLDICGGFIDGEVVVVYVVFVDDVEVVVVFGNIVWVFEYVVLIVDVLVVEVVDDVGDGIFFVGEDGVVVEVVGVGVVVVGGGDCLLKWVCVGVIDE